MWYKVFAAENGWILEVFPEEPFGTPDRYVFGSTEELLEALAGFLNVKELRESKTGGME